jgi:hypothetical protein
VENSQKFLEPFSIATESTFAYGKSKPFGLPTTLSVRKWSKNFYISFAGYK